MSEQMKPDQLNDDLIRQALHLEFESVDPPSVDKSWRRIETRLREGAGPNKTPAFRWFPYAAAAAALLLVVVISSIGIRQVSDLASLSVEEEAPLATAEYELEALPAEALDEPPVKEPEPLPAEEREAVEEEVGQLDTLAEEAVARELPFEKEADPSPPEWRDLLPENLVFEEAVLLGAGEGPEYQGAIYQREQDIILWVKSKIMEEETVSFIKRLGEHIQVEPRQIREVNGYIYFEAAGQPGLAWKEADLNQALLVLSGFISFEQLESITEHIY